jgi:uncharacterized protein (DUF1810 family)
MAMPDPLDRFVTAQATTWDGALAELAAGAKHGHWMWFIFPQLAGLGRSATAQHYAITDLAEARAYLAHPLLGPRLVAATRTLLGHAGHAPETILGSIDAMKLRSCLTLFEAAGGDPVFAEALDAFYAGSRDPMTLTLLGR